MIRQVEVEACAHIESAWTVEAIGSDGEIYQAIFVGPDAESRAREYARLKYGVTDQLLRRSA